MGQFNSNKTKQQFISNEISSNTKSCDIINVQVEENKFLSASIDLKENNKAMKKEPEMKVDNEILNYQIKPKPIKKQDCETKIPLKNDQEKNENKSIYDTLNLKSSFDYKSKSEKVPSLQKKSTTDLNEFKTKSFNSKSILKNEYLNNKLFEKNKTNLNKIRINKISDLNCNSPELNEVSEKNKKNKINKQSEKCLKIDDKTIKFNSSNLLEEKSTAPLTTMITNKFSSFLNTKFKKNTEIKQVGSNNLHNKTQTKRFCKPKDEIMVKLNKNKDAFLFSNEINLK